MSGMTRMGETNEGRRFREQPALIEDGTYGLLRQAAAHNPDCTAISFFETIDAAPVHITHRQFLEAINQVANALHRLGVGPSSVVSLIAPSTPDAVVALWGAAATGIVNPINFLLKPDDLAALMRAAGTEVLLAFGPHPRLDLWQRATEAGRHVPSLKTVLTLGPKDTGGTLALRDLMQNERATGLDSERSIRPDDICACFHTGGTTGRPKLAKHSHGNQVAAATALARAWSFSRETRIVNGLPLFHVAGSILTGLAPLAAGGEIVIPTAAGLRNPEVVARHWELVERFRPTVIGGIPTSLVALLDVPVGNADLSSVEFCATGGAPLPQAVGAAFTQRFGLEVREIYGMTETSGLISVAPVGSAPRYGWAGRRADGMEIQARQFAGDGPPGKALPDGEAGVLVVRGPTVFSGYLDPRQTDAVMTADGWLVTGDLGIVDPDGWIQVTGRSKDVIIRGGHNIDPAVIEEAASTHPAIATAAAVGMPDRYAGEVPLLFVTARQGQTIDIDDVDAHMRRSVPEGPARPREIVVIDAMPLTAVGKISKVELRHAAMRKAALVAIDAALQHASAAARIEIEETPGAAPVAKIVVDSAKASSHKALAEGIGEALSGFTFRHVVSFANAGQA
jgi:fatty-acyl-CoA synthase